MKSPPSDNSPNDLLAGATTFLAMSYIMFANPAILKDIGLNPGAVFIWTCLISALTSFFAGRYLDVPAALAPGMGFNAFVSSFGTNEGIPWPTLILICGTASIGLLLVSKFTSWRRDFISGLVESGQIFSAIKGGVGAMLATVSIEETITFAKDLKADQLWIWWAPDLFFIGFVIIVCIWLASEHFRGELEQVNDIMRNLLQMAKPASFLLSIAVLGDYLFGRLKCARSDTTRHLPNLG
jgi:xanthine/uracil/vitamin C permease (AzgA family)